MSELERTVWKITGLPDWPHRVSIELTIDTAAGSVVDDVERAAKLAGIELERVVEEATA
jgi:hypothetical protein